MKEKKIVEVALNATVDNKPIWSQPTGLAAKAYGIAKYVNIREGLSVVFTRVRFISAPEMSL